MLYKSKNYKFATNIPLHLESQHVDGTGRVYGTPGQARTPRYARGIVAGFGEGGQQGDVVVIICAGDPHTAAPAALPNTTSLDHTCCCPSLRRQPDAESPHTACA